MIAAWRSCWGSASTDLPADHDQLRSRCWLRPSPGAGGRCTLNVERRFNAFVEGIGFTDDPIHGQQEGMHYYRHYCYLIIFSGEVRPVPISRRRTGTDRAGFGGSRSRFAGILAPLPSRDYVMGLANNDRLKFFAEFHRQLSATGLWTLGHASRPSTGERRQSPIRAGSLRVPSTKILLGWTGPARQRCVVYQCRLQARDARAQCQTIRLKLLKIGAITPGSLSLQRGLRCRRFPRGVPIKRNPKNEIVPSLRPSSA